MSTCHLRWTTPSVNEASFFRHVQTPVKRSPFFFLSAQAIVQRWTMWNKVHFYMNAGKQYAFPEQNALPFANSSNVPSLHCDLHLYARITLCCNVLVYVHCDAHLLLLNNEMWELFSIIATVIIFMLHGFMHKTCEMHWIFLRIKTTFF